ncbi:PHD finger protein 21B [Bombina bombina]|uniref:PHD finger protein 21B n=1 Tax=Bombina bombina TaxID=8345 RepID=UPI00235A89B5|nr:PHD finger protein 21B [Bombina bombina]
MELQSLQEAIKVEIQCHQKLAVRSCPVASAKAIPLIKAPSSQGISISVVPAKAPVTMVTAHLNGQKTSTVSATAHTTEPLQASPINLQTNKLAGGNLNIATRRVSEMSHVQVRPKTLIPESLPISLCREQPSKQPPTFQKATVVSIKNPSPALPTANNTVSHIKTSGSQSQHATEGTISSPINSAGVAYAIISTSPSNANPINTSTVSVVNDGIKVQPLLISADSKVDALRYTILGRPANAVWWDNISDLISQDASLNEIQDSLRCKQHSVFVSTDTEIQSKRHERKRRSTANPAYSGFLEPERKRLASTFLNNPFLSVKANEDPYWKNEINHDVFCSACKRGSSLQPCSTCPRAYHLDCVDPPLKIAPKGIWVCPKCQQKVLKKDNLPWTGTVAIVQSYVTHKTVKEEEKRKLLKKGSELKNEHRQLEDQERLLNNAIKKCLEVKNSLLAQQKRTQSSLERLKTLIRLIQSEQMIQVTMATNSSSLLTVPWIKPSSAIAVTHKSLQLSQSNYRQPDETITLN